MYGDQDLGNLLGSFQPQSNVIKQDRVDKGIYKELMSASSELQTLSTQGLEHSVAWTDLLRDMWASFYKADPCLADKSLIDLSHQLNRPIMERVLEDPETDQTRTTTMLDDLSAGLATLGAGQRLLQEIEDRPELKEAFKKVDAAKQLEEFNNGSGTGNEEHTAEELVQQAEQQLQQHARDLRRAVRESIEAGQQKAEEGVHALSGWGIDTKDLTSVSLHDRLELVKKLTTPRMKKITDAIGRLRNLARARQKSRVKHDRDEIYSLTQGADLDRVLPTELAALNHPARRLDFFRRFTERGLSQYDLQAKKALGRGPIISCVDVSGSMMQGERMEWAIGTTLALLDTAIRQKRRMAVIFFDSQVKKRIDFDKLDIGKMMEVATMGSTGGGTSFDAPLQEGLNIIKEIGFQKADIVLITDGCCRLANLQSIMDQKEKLGVRICSVLIGSTDGEDMKLWSDHVWAVSRITDEVAGDIFAEVF
jgi:uncharacterized protein with von Willebrand factor type A (vWA) domain